MHPGLIIAPTLRHLTEGLKVPCLTRLPSQSMKHTCSEGYLSHLEFNEASVMSLKLGKMNPFPF